MQFADLFNSKNLGTTLGGIGAIGGMFGSFYSAKSQASSLKFKSDMDAINAKMSELQAQSILTAGERATGNLTLKAGKIKSAQRAAMAANGIDLGVGNAAEVQATTDIMKEIDVFTINSNAVRESNAARMQAVNFRNESLLSGTTAGSISPFGAGISSLLTSATSVASSYYRDKRLSELLGK